MSRPLIRSSRAMIHPVVPDPFFVGFWTCLPRVELLCNGVLPKWINMLARFVSGLPFIESVLPSQWIRPSLMYEVDMDVADDDNSPADTDGQKSESAASPAEHNRKSSTNGTRIQLIHATSDRLPEESCNGREK
ncbi:uncharacterized protein DEA37_0004604 [Paragonimus westermani]|uniref:Uncharacterized protein n=1 Tax=Paragonimus westermani TaxID=34504 RepID=A0A5J4NCP3_9TREM|nr:uncharacterized protein DEA37_0004604 [Paragonimus westermani]